MRHSKVIITILLFFGVYAILHVTQPSAGSVTFPEDTLIIQPANSTQSAYSSHNFTIELATTPEQRAHGLMFRDNIADNHGMLFYSGKEELLSMWMKNTLAPLDMLFISGDGTILHIVRRATPESEDIISFDKPAAAVLEIKGGMADKLNIHTGDKVKHRFFVQ